MSIGWGDGRVWPHVHRGPVVQVMHCEGSRLFTKTVVRCDTCRRYVGGREVPGLWSADDLNAQGER